MAGDVIQALEVKQLVVSSGGTFVNSGTTHTRTGQIYHIAASRGRPGATASVGYVATGTDKPILTLAASATADTWVIPITWIHEGDIITKMGIHGQIESAGNGATIDYELRKMTAVASGSTDASVQTGTQISKTADYLVDDSTDLATPYTIICGDCLYMLVTCTTAAATDIELLSICVELTEK